jgi:hypothetical protein
MSAIYRLLPCPVIGWLIPILFAWPAGAAGTIAYVGPGAGLSMLGALFAVTCVILLALLGLILYPIRLLRSILRHRKTQRAALGSGCVSDGAIFPKTNATVGCPVAAEQASGDCLSLLETSCRRR